MWRLIPLMLAIVEFSHAKLELVAVQSVFRHGDRASSAKYPKSLTDAKSWPNGWAQLTDLGARQTQELGSYYRRQYFQSLQLSKQQNVYMRSTSKTRAIESAQNVLVGLFERNTKLPEIYVPGEYKQDLLLKPNSVKCPKYNRILESDNDVLFAKYDKMYNNFFAKLSDLTGYNVSMQNIDLVYDAVYREVVHGLSNDRWLFDSVLNKETGELVTFLDMILELKRIQRLGEFNSMEKSKLRTGYLLGQIFDQFDRVTDEELLPKLTLYSSHDATLTSLLYSLNASNEFLVPYAAAITFELYVNGEHKPNYYVKTFYRNETGNDQAYELQINGCERPACEFNQFKQVLEKAIFKSMEEQKMECERD